MKNIHVRQIGEWKLSSARERGRRKIIWKKILKNTKKLNAQYEKTYRSGRVSRACEWMWVV